MSFQSSSEAALEYFLFPILKKLIGYESQEEAHKDRVNHRALWYELIKAINFNDPTTLANVIFNNKDVYCGIRNITEYNGIREADPGIISVWVDASKRCDPEDNSSCTVTAEDMDIVLHNNGTIDELKTQIGMLVEALNEAQRLTDILYEGDTDGTNPTDDTSST